MKLVDFLRATFPLNRVVALLTPVFAALAGTVSVWLANHLPLVAEQVGPKQVEEIFIAGAAAGLAAAYKWLDGWQKHEARENVEAEAMVNHSLAAGEPPTEEELQEVFPEDRPSEEDLAGNGPVGEGR